VGGLGLGGSSAPSLDVILGGEAAFV